MRCENLVYLDQREYITDSKSRQWRLRRVEVNYAFFLVDRFVVFFLAFTVFGALAVAEVAAVVFRRPNLPLLAGAAANIS